MNRERKRKLDARKRRQESLESRWQGIHTSEVEEIKKPIPKKRGRKKKN